MVVSLLDEDSVAIGFEGTAAEPGAFSIIHFILFIMRHLLIQSETVGFDDSED